MYPKFKLRKVHAAFLRAELISTMIFLFTCQYSFAQQNSTATTASSDTFDIKHATFLMPQELPKWKFSQAISVYYVVPPKDWTLDIVKAPFFNYSCKLALPAAFNLQASFSTILVANRLSVGPFWNYSINNFHFAAGYQLAFNYGYLSQFGFQTKLFVWEQQPSLTAAYSFGKTAVIIRGDLYYTSSVSTYLGGTDVSAHEQFLNGYSVTATFDQRLYKNKVMSLGLKINYVRYHIIAWPALPVNSYRYVVPEFQIGLNL